MQSIALSILSLPLEKIIQRLPVIFAIDVKVAVDADDFTDAFAFGDAH